MDIVENKRDIHWKFIHRWCKFEKIHNKPFYRFRVDSLRRKESCLAVSVVVAKDENRNCTLQPVYCNEKAATKNNRRGTGNVNAIRFLECALDMDNVLDHALRVHLQCEDLWNPTEVEDYYSNFYSYNYLLCKFLL